MLFPMGTYWGRVVVGLAFVAAAACGACGDDVVEPPKASGPVYGYRVDSSVSDPQVVRDAVSQLNAHIGRAILVERPDGVPVVNKPLEGLSGRWVDGTVYFDERECIRAGEGRTRDYTIVTLKHEMSHMLGLGHVELGYSIMSPNLKPGGQWSELDQAECRRVGVCP